MGEKEFAWQWNNFDFKERYKGCFVKDFAFYDDMRWWEYQYDPSIPEHHCVRVTYREDLLPAGDDLGCPQFKPYIQGQDGSLITDPGGQPVLASLPPLTSVPPFERWKFAEKADAEGARSAREVAAQAARKAARQQRQHPAGGAL